MATTLKRKAMNSNSSAVCRLLSAVLLTCLTVNLAFAADWSTNLVWSGGGLWTKRIPVSIENATQNPMLGTPIAVKLPEAGVPAHDIRLTKADGTELVFGLTPDGTTLLIPVEAEPGQKADYFVYFGNEKAIPVPDMLEATDNLAGTPAPEPKVIVGEIENIPYNIISAETDWKKIAKEDYLCRSTFRVINTTDADMNDLPVLMVLRGTQAHGLIGPLTDLTLADGSPVYKQD